MGRLEEEAWMLMERHKISWEEALVMTPEQRAMILEQDEPPAEGETPPVGGEASSAEEPTPAEEPVDTYAGPQADDVVGDNRRLKIVSIDPMSGMDSVIVGEVWQGEDGTLHGTGLAAVMLFEPTAAIRYRRTSVSLDVSPLTVFHARIARSAFMRGDMVEDENG